MRKIIVIFIVVLFLMPLIRHSLRHFRQGKQKESVLESYKEETSDIHDEVLNYRLQSKERVRQIQAALQKAGYYKEEIDGKLGPRTKRAIKEFQKAKKMNPDGVVGPKTWEALSQY